MASTRPNTRGQRLLYLGSGVFLSHADSRGYRSVLVWKMKWKKRRHQNDTTGRTCSWCISYMRFSRPKIWKRYEDVQTTNKSSEKWTRRRITSRFIYWTSPRLESERKKIICPSKGNVQRQDDNKRLMFSPAPINLGWTCHRTLGLSSSSPFSVSWKTHK